VIAPSSLTFKKTADNAFKNPISASTQGAAMRCSLTVGPSSVCFSRVQWLEISRPATDVWGYFKTEAAADLVHHPNEDWLTWNMNNTGLNDTAGFWGRPIGKAGGFTWVVPNHYRVVGTSDSTLFTTTYQVFKMTKDGTSTVTKAGQATTPRKPT
jgi:hypothetical protein